MIERWLIIDGWYYHADAEEVVVSQRGVRVELPCEDVFVYESITLPHTVPWSHTFFTKKAALAEVRSLAAKKLKHLRDDVTRMEQMSDE